MRLCQTINRGIFFEILDVEGLQKANRFAERLKEVLTGMESKSPDPRSTYNYMFAGWTTLLLRRRWLRPSLIAGGGYSVGDVRIGQIRRSLTGLSSI